MNNPEATGTGLELRMATVPLTEGRGTVVELSAAPSATMPLVVVCDLSDSCPVMARQYEAMKRLAAILPRVWPVWIYPLSSIKAPELSSQPTVGDLQDGALCVADVLQDRPLLGACRESGSFLRPVLEAVAERTQEEGFVAVLMVVLSDGQLCDCAPLQVPKGWRVVGIAPDNSPSDVHNHWSRVLPGTRLISLEDRRLDEAFDGVCNAFYGRCGLQWLRSDATPVAVRVYDADRGEWTSPTGNSTICNLASSSVWLLLDGQAERHSVRLRCTSRSGKIVTLHLDANLPAIAPATLEILQESLRRADRPVGEILLDVASSQPEFAPVWKDVRTAHDLVQTRRRWVDAAGELAAFGSALRQSRTQQLHGPETCQALLCLASAPLDQEAPACGRVVLVGLCRNDKPALRWKRRQDLGFATVSSDVEIYYDWMERRWTLRLGGKDPQELDPTGSQEVTGIGLEGGVGPWRILFSGDLTPS